MSPVGAPSILASPELASQVKSKDGKLTNRDDLPITTPIRPGYFGR
jgi:hypothetical protein